MARNETSVWVGLSRTEGLWLHEHSEASCAVGGGLNALAPISGSRNHRDHEMTEPTGEWPTRQSAPTRRRGEQAGWRLVRRSRRRAG
jgi:hypothetical protein